MSNDNCYIWSPYHKWFVEMGYPQLDITQYEDGEWAIIEWQNRPIMPATTQFHHILKGMRNVLITRGFVEKYVKQIDTQKKEFWDREEAASQAVEDEFEETQNKADDLATAATKAVTGNPDLMERIVKKGISEMDIFNVRKNVPNHHF